MLAGVRTAAGVTPVLGGGLGSGQVTIRYDPATDACPTVAAFTG